MQSFDSIEAKLGADLTISGSAALENQERLTGDFSVGDVSLINVMAPVFLPWSGRPATLEETFAKTLPFGLTGEVWVRPKSLEIYPGLAVSNSEIGITATAEEMRFIASAKTAEGDDVVVEIAATPSADGQKIAASSPCPLMFPSTSGGMTGWLLPPDWPVSIYILMALGGVLAESWQHSMAREPLHWLMANC